MATTRRGERESRASAPKRGSGFFRGEAGMRRAAEELERQKELAEQRRNQTHMPFRFRVKVGETARAVILDDKPDFFMFEHNMKGPDGKWNVFTGCVKDFDNCPACEAAGRESYYALFLTVLDFTEFETRNGETVDFSRKLLVVKPAQQKKFMRFYEKEGTLRGAEFEFTRDGDKDSSIGNDIEFVDFMDEKELATYVRDWTDKDKKKHTEDCSEPFVYEELFEEPDADKLRAIVGGKPTPGSRGEEAREFGERRRTRRGRDDDADDRDDEGDDDGDRPARGRGRPERTERAGRTERSERPARSERSARGSERTARASRREEGNDAEGWEDPDGGAPWKAADEQKDDAPPPRTRRGRPAPEEDDAPPPRTRRGREEEPEEDRPAGRRVQPRRGGR